MSVPGPGAVPIPVSWRSYARAVFFTAVLVVFGVAAIFVPATWARVAGVLMIVIALVLAADFLVAGRRWTTHGSQLVVPRLWARDRTLSTAAEWTAGLDAVMRRDSLFVVDCDDGRRVVSPNLLIARADVRQWLFLIGEERTGR